jgi:hypothetical protein
MKSAWLGPMLAVVLVISTSPPVPAVTLGLDPPAQSVSVGEQVEVALVIAGLGAAVPPSLGTFDIDVTFDATVLSLNDVAYGDPALGDQLDLLGLGSVTATGPGAGSVSLFELSIDPIAELNDLQADAFTLAVLTFGAVGPGSSGLNLAVNALGDAEGASLLTAVTEIGSASVQVTGPVGQATGLESGLGLGIGLIAVGGRWLLARRRCRKRR